MTTSIEVRAKLVDVLELDLIGPRPGHALAEETLSQAPSRWYLTGFLIPHETPIEDRADEEAQDDPDQTVGKGLGDDESSPDRPSKRRAFFPSSLGISVLVPPGVSTLEVEAHWGDYQGIEVTKAEPKADPKAPATPDAKSEPASKAIHWKRTPRVAKASVTLARKKGATVRTKLEGFPDITLVTTVRSGREKKHFLNPVPIHAIEERWIRKFEKQRIEALSALKSALEGIHTKRKKDG